ncbi:MAG TPA: DUF808 domain-containing protein, partial [Burkholderiaceae bacterium]|nr:DUF808 domain-containing protein [Burkholderiaceae bacterium]
ILVHGWPWLHHAVEGIATVAGSGWVATVISTLLGGLSGVAAGALALGVVTLGQKVFGRKSEA